MKKRPQLHRYSRRYEYYDLGHGVNEAEALRQDLIVDIFLLHKEKQADIFDKLERLATLAGAKAYRKWPGGTK